MRLLAFIVCAPLIALAVFSVFVVTVTTRAVASVVVRVKYRIEE